MGRFVTLVEVGPRDGLQNEPTILPTEAKIEFINRAIDAGLKHIEAVSFVNPKKVPQMADADAVMAGVPRGRGAIYCGLVLNQRGFERAVAAGCDEILFVTSSTDSFSLRNQGMPVVDAIAAWHRVAHEAAERGIRASVSISNAFGCPFEGRVPVSRIVEIAAELVKAPIGDLTIPDTIGVAVPPQVTQMWNALKPHVGDVPLRAHFHNTRNNRHRQCLCRGRGRGDCRRRLDRRHRRLPLRAARHRQCGDRGRALSAAGNGRRNRGIARRADRRGALAGAAAGPYLGRHGGTCRRLPDAPCRGSLIQISDTCIDFKITYPAAQQKRKFASQYLPRGRRWTHVIPIRPAPARAIIRARHAAEVSDPTPVNGAHRRPTRPRIPFVISSNGRCPAFFRRRPAAII